MKSRMDDPILLINPPYIFDWETEKLDHLGLGYIASYVRSRGYKNVELLNAVNFPEIISKLKEFQPKYVGIAVPFTISYMNALKVAKLVKEANPKTIVVMGGVYPSAYPKEVLETNCVDYVVRGEGEIAFVHILEGEENRILEYPVVDLDALPFPERPINKNRVGIITSRGCPFDCSFCCVHLMWGKKWRSRSPENVIEEIKTIPAPFLAFEDDNLTLDRDRSARLFSLMAKECNLKWYTPNGIYVDSLDFELLKLMKASGCYCISLAIESGDDFIRTKVMRKHVGRDKIYEVARGCRELGILTMGFFIIGMPQETKESMLNSLEMAKELKLDAINIAIATPYPGSELHETCIKNNYLLNSDYDIYDPRCNCVIETPYLKAKEVEEFQAYFIEEWERDHDARSPINAATKHRMIKRPYEMSNRSHKLL